MAHDAFICHATKNADVAQRIVARLEAAGIACWIAPRNVVAGASYPGQIMAAIRASRILVLIFSEAADGSPHVQRELENAIREKVAILPFRLDLHPPCDDMAYFIGSQHWIVATAPDWEPGEQMLAEHVRARLVQIGPKTAVGEDGEKPPPAISTGASERVQRRIGGLMDEAEACESRGDWAGAVARYDAVLELAPEDRAVARLRSVALRKANGAEKKAPAASGAGGAKAEGPSSAPRSKDRDGHVGGSSTGGDTPSAPRIPVAPAVSAVRRLERVHAPAFPGFIRIEPGEFLMGSPDSDEEAFDDEKPQHRVRIMRPFEMGVTPVTQDLYRAVTGKNPSGFEGNDRPVESVSWFDAVAFCNALSREEGLPEAYRIDGKSVEWLRRSPGYRLPTEAEWEYACRAGSAQSRYGEPDAVAWYDGNSGHETRAVGGKKPNAWGLHDMLGNVWEWMWDWKDAYSSGTATDPTGPSTGACRVVRGGSWNYCTRDVRAARRSRSGPGIRYVGLGFRLSRSVP